MPEDAGVESWNPELMQSDALTTHIVHCLGLFRARICKLLHSPGFSYRRNRFLGIDSRALYKFTGFIHCAQKDRHRSIAKCKIYFKTYLVLLKSLKLFVQCLLYIYSNLHIIPTHYSILPHTTYTHT
jgi:hypothetical protein